MTDQIQQLNALLRQRYPSFLHKCFQELNPGQTYLRNWHIQAMCHALIRASRGDGRRLMLCVPPRHLKTICSTKALAAFLLGHDPSLNIICVSYSADLAIAHSRDFRRIVEAPWYRGLFPKFQIAASGSGGANTQSEIRTTLNGGRYATSVEGTLTGRGADLIIIDDPIKPDAGMSKAERDAVNNWYRNTLVTRLNNPTEGRIIIVMQRVHGDDLVGHLLDLEGENWDVLNIPAIAYRDETYRIGDGLEDLYQRRSGEVIDPRSLDQEGLERQRRSMGSQHFEAQYQQNPQPEGGNIIHREWLHTVTPEVLAIPCDGIVQSWDTASSSAERADYSVCTTWEIRGENYVLVDVFRKRLDYPTLKSIALERASQPDVHYVLIENAGTGKALAQEMHGRVPANVRYCHPNGDKTMRLIEASTTFESGRVFLPETAPWKEALIEELLSFPASRHDDQVDSVSQFLNWVRRSAFRPGILEEWAAPPKRPLGSLDLLKQARSRA